MHPCAHVCMCVYLLVYTCTWDQARSLNISDCFLRLFFSVWLCVGACLCKCLGKWVSLTIHYLCVCVFVRVSLLSAIGPGLLLPLAIFRQHSIRPERPDYVPRPAGSASPRRISRFEQQHSAPAPQTLSLQWQPVFSLHQRGGALCAQPVCSHPRYASAESPGPRCISAALKVHTNSLLDASHAD